VVAAGIQEVRPRSVVDADGVEREVDTIIFGTGYHVTDVPPADQVRGPDGALLEDVWRGSPRAYLGTSVPRFPNFFMLLGPNTGLGHSSIYMIESQIAHVRSAICAIDEAGAATIEVRRRRTRRSTARWTPACAGPCGTPGAARASTWIEPVATPPYGRTGSGAYGGCASSSTPSPTSSPPANRR
jgi:cation diffusion facilitator CzcD-associated flavoprotein CzcO